MVSPVLSHLSDSYSDSGASLKISWIQNAAILGRSGTYACISLMSQWRLDVEIKTELKGLGAGVYRAGPTL